MLLNFDSKVQDALFGYHYNVLIYKSILVTQLCFSCQMIRSMVAAIESRINVCEFNNKHDYHESLHIKMKPVITPNGKQPYILVFIS